MTDHVWLGLTNVLAPRVSTDPRRFQRSLTILPAPTIYPSLATALNQHAIQPGPQDHVARTPGNVPISPTPFCSNCIRCSVQRYAHKDRTMAPSTRRFRPRRPSTLGRPIVQPCLEQHSNQVHLRSFPRNVIYRSIWHMPLPACLVTAGKNNGRHRTDAPILATQIRPKCRAA